MADETKAEDPVATAQAALLTEQRKQYEARVAAVQAAMAEHRIGIVARPVAEIGEDGLTHYSATWNFALLAP